MGNLLWYSAGLADVVLWWWCFCRSITATSAWWVRLGLIILLPPCGSYEPKLTCCQWVVVLTDPDDFWQKLRLPKGLPSSPEHWCADSPPAHSSILSSRSLGRLLPTHDWMHLFQLSWLDWGWRPYSHSTLTGSLATMLNPPWLPYHVLIRSPFYWPCVSVSVDLAVLWIWVIHVLRLVGLFPHHPQLVCWKFELQRHRLDD